VCGLFFGTAGDNGPVIYHRGEQYRVANVNRLELYNYGTIDQNGVPVVIVITKEWEQADNDVSGECYIIPEESLAFLPGAEPVTDDTTILREWLVTDRTGRRRLVAANSPEGASRSANREVAPSDETPVVPMNPTAPLWVCRYRNVDNETDSCTLVAADTLHLAEGLVRAYYNNTLASKPVITPLDVNLIDLRTKSPVELPKEDKS
jgi:hypothetical protein